MSCTNYRFLIQQRFDEDLNIDDADELDAHLEHCESCGKFDHQLEQMINGAVEVALPEDFTPPNPESLARIVQQQIPQQKSSIFQMFFGMLEGLKNKGKKDSDLVTAGRGRKGKVTEESSFPKRSPRGGRVSTNEDDSSVSAKLRSLRKSSIEPMDDKDAQSATSSLGHRFGLSQPEATTDGASTSPLNLAESIRRKISATQTPEDESSFDPDESEASGAFQMQTGPGMSPGWGGPAASSPQAFQNEDSRTQETSWDSRPPRGHAGADPDWGPPPQGGSWDEPAGEVNPAASTPSWNQPQSQASNAINAWGNPPSQSSSTSQAPTAGQNNFAGWGQTNTAPTQAPNEQSGWAQPSEDAWASPSVQQTDDSQTGSAWGDNDQNSSGWGQEDEGASAWGATSSPPSPQPDSPPQAPWGATAPPSPQSTPAWGDSNSDQSNWGGIPSTPPVEPPSTGNDGWGSQNQQVSTPTSSTPATGGFGDPWGQPAIEGKQETPSAGTAPWAASNATNTPTNDPLSTDSGWGSPAVDNAGWGAPAPNAEGWGVTDNNVPASPPVVQEKAPDNWGASDWGNPGTTSQEVGWGTPAPAETSAPWGAPAGTPQTVAPSQGGPTPPAQVPQPSPGGWSVPGQGQMTTQSGADSNQWGMPQAFGQNAQAPGDNTQQSGGELTPGAATQTAGAAGQRGWSLEAEQMETGTWQAYAPSNPDNSLGPATMPSPQSGGFTPPGAIQPPVPSSNPTRWDQPISTRVAEVQADAPLPVENAQSAGQDVQSYWDLPIQEKLKAPGEQVAQSKPLTAETIVERVETASPTQPTTGAVGLFGGLDDSAMDQIFSNNLGIKENPAINQAAHSGAQFTAQIPAQTPPQQTQASPEPPTFTQVGRQSTDNAAQSNWGAPAAIPPGQASDFPTMSSEIPFNAANMNIAGSTQDTAQSQTPKFTAIPARTDLDQNPQTHAPVSPPPTLPQSGGGLFDKIDDSDVDRIFADIGVQEASIPVGGTAPGPQGATPFTNMSEQQAPLGTAPGFGIPQPQAPANPPVSNTGFAPPGAFSQFGQQMDQSVGLPPANAAGFGAPPVQPVQPLQPVQPVQPPQPVQAPINQPQAEPPAGGLFNINDSDMDELFGNVMADPVSTNALDRSGPAAIAPAVNPQMNQQHSPPSTSGAMPNLTSVPGNGSASSVSSTASSAASSAAPFPSIAPQPEPIPVPTAHIPASSGPPPKIEGIGKLDATVNTSDTGSGRIAAIGKFLFDQQDIDTLSNIAKANQQDIKMRVLTLEASADLQGLLTEISTQQGVIGSVIVGHDGLLIANTMPEDMDAESIGVWALGVYMNTEHVIKKMGHKRVHQVVSRTPRGYVVIADFGGGLLVCITEGTETNLLIPLMRKITDLVS